MMRISGAWVLSPAWACSRTVEGASKALGAEAYDGGVPGSGDRTGLAVLPSPAELKPRCARGVGSSSQKAGAAQGHDMTKSKMATGCCGLLIASLGAAGAPALAQTAAGTGLPSGFTAPGLPFGPTATVATVAAPTPTMALANPGGLSFGGASGVSGLGTSTPGTVGNAGGLSFGGGMTAATSVGGGAGVASATGSPTRRPLDDVTGSVGSGGGGGAPAGAGISGGAGFSRRPTDAYFDPLAGSGLR